MIDEPHGGAGSIECAGVIVVDAPKREERCGDAFARAVAVGTQRRLGGAAGLLHRHEQPREHGLPGLAVLRRELGRRQWPGYASPAVPQPGGNGSERRAHDQCRQSTRVAGRLPAILRGETGPDLRRRHRLQFRGLHRLWCPGRDGGCQRQPLRSERSCFVHRRVANRARPHSGGDHSVVRFGEGQLPVQAVSGPPYAFVTLKAVLGRWAVLLVTCSLILLLILASSTALAQEPSPDAQQTPTVVPTPSAPEEPAAVVKSSPAAPTGMIRLADDTWLRFGFQLQVWFRAAQDRVKQPDGSDGGYAMDFYCRRCRFIASGSVVRNVSFLFLFESGNLGKADPNSLTGTKAVGVLSPPILLDAWGALRLHNAFTISAGNILLPLTRNGMQPTTTYLSIDNANVDTTPALQGNTVALRDLGAQLSGFLFGYHLEYRVGLFQGTRGPAMMNADIPPVTTRNASHNMFRTVAMLQLNLWDPEKGYFNGGHYFGRKKVLGVFASFDYQKLGTDDFPAGVPKDPYFGVSSRRVHQLSLEWRRRSATAGTSSSPWRSLDTTTAAEDPGRHHHAGLVPRGDSADQPARRSGLLQQEPEVLALRQVRDAQDLRRLSRRGLAQGKQQRHVDCRRPQVLRRPSR